MKRAWWLVVALGVLAIGGGAALWQRPEKFTSRSEFLMDTVVEIKVAAPDSAEVQSALSAAFAEMNRVDGLLSAYDSHSEVSRINRSAGEAPCEVSAETLKVLTASKRYGRLSGGAFDVTVGPLVDLWGFGTQDKRVPSSDEIAGALRYVGADGLELDATAGTARLAAKGMRLDLGAIAKGYAVDAALAELRRHGIRSVLVNAGSSSIGSLGQREGGQPWKIGIADPRGSATTEAGMLGVIALTQGDVGTSSDTQRYFIKDGKRYHHILDPRTGAPARGTKSVTVVADTALDADALSTALFVLPPKAALALAEKLGVEAMVLDSAGRLTKTRGFPTEGS